MRVTRTFADESPARRALLLARQAERDRVCRALLALCAGFDAELGAVRRAKSDIDVRLKLAEYRHVLCFQELSHLRDFDAREQALDDKRAARDAEVRSLGAAAARASAGFVASKKELGELQQKEKSVLSAFAAVLGEGNKMETFCTRMFKRKIKRARVVVAVAATQARRARKSSGLDGDVGENGDTPDGIDEDEEEEEDDEDDEDDSDDGSESDGSEDGFDDSVCPPGLDAGLYARIVALRDQRLDAEEAVATCKKTCEAQRKEV
jgi:hypothetical protein